MQLQQLGWMKKFLPGQSLHERSKCKNKTDAQTHWRKPSLLHGGKPVDQSGDQLLGAARSQMMGIEAAHSGIDKNAATRNNPFYNPLAATNPKMKEKSQAFSILSAPKRGELAFLFAHWSCLLCRWTYHQLFDFCCSGCQWTAGHSDHEKGWPGGLLVGFARLDWFEIWGDLMTTPSFRVQKEKMGFAFLRKIYRHM